MGVRLKRWFSAVLGLTSSSAVACSCIGMSELKVEDLQSELRRYPAVVEGRVVSTDAPFVCHIAPLRWIAMIWTDDVQVTHAVEVRAVVAGKVGRDLKVVEKQTLEFGGCESTPGTMCGPVFGEDWEWLVLGTNSDGTYFKADICSSQVVLDALASDRAPSP